VTLYLVPGISVDAYALACLAVLVVTLGSAVILVFRYLRRQQEQTK
jgi:hypothetical protein